MSRRNLLNIAFAAAAVLSCLPAHADLVSGASSTTVATAVDPTAEWAEAMRKYYAAEAARTGTANTAVVAPSGHQTVLGVLNLAITPSQSTLSANAGNFSSASAGSTPALGVTRPYLVTLSDNFELTLWNYVTSARAQQSSDPLAVAQGTANTLNQTLDASAVPLPGSAFLMLTGLLGFAGMKMKKRNTTRGQAAPLVPAGMAFA